MSGYRLVCAHLGGAHRQPVGAIHESPVSASLLVGADLNSRGEAAVLKFSSTFFKRWRGLGAVAVIVRVLGPSGTPVPTE